MVGATVIPFLAVLGGYFAAVATHFGLGFLITRESRTLLMRGDCMSPFYYMQLGLSWVLAGAAGAAVSLLISPLAPMGTIMVTCTGFLLAASLVRAHRNAPHQQTGFASVLLLLCLATGCTASCLLFPRV
jgi:apolipoprotein N-acyltransferase